jgi:hypothetical protein
MQNLAHGQDFALVDFCIIFISDLRFTIGFVQLWQAEGAASSAPPPLV